MFPVRPANFLYVHCMRYDLNQCADSKRKVVHEDLLVYNQLESIDFPEIVKEEEHRDLCARAPRIQTRLNRRGGLPNVRIPNQRLR